jgi:serine/threonine protein kinase
MEERYKKEEILGEGTYGIVYKGIDRETGQVVAIKKVKFEQEEDEGIPATTLREISALKQLKHRNVVQLLDVILEERRIYLIFEYIENDLRKFLNNLT